MGYIKSYIKSPKADIIRFSDLIYNMFNNISAQNDLYLVGDLNIYILMNNLKNKYFIDFIYSMGCRPIITIVVGDTSWSIDLLGIVIILIHSLTIYFVTL